MSDDAARSPRRRRGFLGAGLASVVLLGIVVARAGAAAHPPPASPSATHAEVAPLDPALARGRLVENVACRTDPSKTYTLYLPTTYRVDRRWPLMLIFDPGAQSVSAAEVFREAAEAYGWILVATNDSRNGPMEPIVAAMQVLWPEVHERFASDPRRIYAAGFSGGGVVAEWLGRTTGSLAGLIQTGGRWDPSFYETKVTFAHWGSAGDADFNYQEMRRLHAQLAKWGAPQRFEVFAGRHVWMPPAVARAAFEWMEIQAMREGRRAIDESLVARLLTAEQEKASRLVASEPWRAQELYDAIARDYAGVADVSEAARQAAALAADPRVRQYRRDEERWNDYELALMRDTRPVLGNLGATGTVAPRLRRDLRIEELQRRSGASGYEGVVARRCLAFLSAQLSVFVPPALFARKDYASLSAVLGLADELLPGRPQLLYNRACVEARLGQRNLALALLEKAVASGWTDVALIEADDDLASLRKEPRFAAVISSLRTPR